MPNSFISISKAQIHSRSPFIHLNGWLAALFRLLSCRFDSIKFRYLLLLLLLLLLSFSLFARLFVYVRTFVRYIDTYICLYVYTCISCDICPGWLPFRISRNDDVKRNIVRCCIFSVFIFFRTYDILRCAHINTLKLYIQTNYQTNIHSNLHTFYTIWRVG